MLQNTSVLMLIIVLLISMLIVVASAPYFIPFLQRLKFGQSIREEGPRSHQKKSGTPTMGGVLFPLAILVPLFILVLGGDKIDTEGLYPVLFLFVGHFMVGFLDDYIKVVLKRNLGLKAREKIIAQLILSAVFAYFMDIKTVWVPVLNLNFDMGWLYYPFVFLVIIGTTNAVNLTDGLDGLLASVTVPVSIAFAVICAAMGKTSLLFVSVALLGTMLGFLRFNAYPARVFMGDTGSLAIGGIIAGVALATDTTLLLVLVGGVYVLEALSVIIQVISFKTRGKRVFRMSPVHHHFELGGWSEQKVVAVFATVSLILSILGVLLFCSR